VDAAEQLAGTHLQARGFSSIVHEPDGNVPPDWLADGRVAVEVRRLNQNELTDVRPVGLEEARFPLIAKMRKLLDALGPSVEGESWYVLSGFRRPVNWRETAGRLTAALQGFRDSAVREPLDHALSRGFWFRLIKAGVPQDHFFVLGGCTDRDSGGFVQSEMLRNIPPLVAEKTRKTAPFRALYPEWWLVLVDYIGYGLSADEAAKLQKRLQPSSDWHKIIIVNPLDARDAFELPVLGAGGAA
jgi:hypothetical protein